MGTEKRERQKANRQRAMAEAARAESRSRTTRIAILVGGAVVLVFLLVIAVNAFTGDDETADDTTEATEGDVADDATDDADDAPVDTEVAPETEAPVLTEPDQVEIPEVDVNPNETVPDGCPSIEKTDEVNREFDEAPPMCLDDSIDYSAVVTTNLGVVEFDLDEEAAPGTTNNFVFLARNGFFDDTVCHRIIQDFVVQCGDPTATGSGGPGYSTPDELPAAGSYEVGSVAMANSGPDTQGSQFFIITGPNGEALPPSYSLFGDVTDDDLDVVAEMDARGSLDTSGTPAAEVRIIDVQIATV